MITSKKKRRFHAQPLSILLSLALGQLSHGETLETDRGDILSGTLQSFDQGVLEFATPLSPAPFQVKASSVYKIEFSRDTSASSSHTEVLTLTNGDRLPCNVISMDENALKISTTYAGDMSLKREGLSSLRFGVGRGEILFTGGQEPQQWTASSGTWTLNDEALYAGSGYLAQKLSLPDKARFQFHLSWEKDPNFIFRFCAENTSARQKQNTYELTINPEGVVINRYPNSTGQVLKIANLSSSEVKALRQPNAALHIDLHVCKSKGVVSLYLNSELAGKWHDPYEALSGDHIIFDNRSEKPSNGVIGKISVSSIIGDIGEKFHDPDLVASKADILTDNQGQVISGKLLTIQPADSTRRLITISHELSAEPEPVPDHHVSTLLFGGETAVQDTARSKYLLALGEGGQLQANEPRISLESVEIEHPILGSLRLSRSFVQSITNKDNHQHEK